MQACAVLPPCSVSRALPLNWSEDAGALSHLVATDSWGEVMLYEFKRVFVSPYGVLMKDGKVLPPSIDYSRRGQRNWPTFVKKIALGRVKRVSGVCVVAHNAYFRNYYHWLLEALPRLFCVRDGIADARLLLCSDVEAFHLQTLQAFPLRDVVLIGRDELVLADRVLFPMPVAPGYGQHNPALLADMAAWIKSRLVKADRGPRTTDRRPLTSDLGPRSPVHPPPSTLHPSPVPSPSRARGGRRLYVGRGADKRRRIVNEEGLLALLDARGFVPVTLEGRGFAEQIALFGEVDMLAGVHGAGLSNMIFMAPGGRVLEFANERYKDGCYFSLAAACGHRTVILPCRLAGPTDRSGPKYYDMEVDLGKARRWLEALENIEHRTSNVER